MATSGVIESQFHSSLPWYKLRVEWSQSKDVSNNRSSVTFNVYVVSTTANYSIISSARPVSYTVDGSSGSFTGNQINNSGGQKSLLGSFQRTINHNSDGSKSFSASVSWNFSGTIRGVYLGNISTSGTITLDSIPRASQPRLSVTTFDMGSTITIYTDRASSSFTHTIRYGFGNVGGTIATNVGSSTTWQVPLSLANQIPNAVEGWGRIHCDTYHNGKHIGTKSVTFYARVPSSVTPTLNDFYIAEHNSAVSQNNIGAYVQNLSQLRIEVWSSHITTAYGSAIKSFKIEFDGKTWNSWAATTNVITKSGNLNVKVTITDGRGRSASRTKTISVISYSYPKITSVNVERTDSSGQNDPLGEYAKITFSGSFSSLTVGGTQKNTATWRVYSRERGVSSWGSVKNSGTVSSGTNVSPSIPIANGYSNTKSYEFRFEIQDKFGTTLSYFVLSSGRTIMSISKDGVGIGKIHENGALDVGDEIFENGGLVAPTGSIVMFAGSTAPTGWIICDGRAIPRATYPKLFSIIGTTYGSGDGSTTFNVPDLRGRVPVGYNSGDSSFNALNKKGGAKTHTLTSDEMPAHTHGMQNENPADKTIVRIGHGQGKGSYGGLRPPVTYWASGADGFEGYISTTRVGGGQSHNNLQPYITLNFIIKAV